MSIPYPLLYYRSRDGSDTCLGIYTRSLQDGSLLIIQAVQNGVEFIIHKNSTQSIIPITFSNDSSISCIGIDGFTMEDKEIIVILLKSSNESLLKHKICQLDAIMIPSNANLNEATLIENTTHIGVSFIPTYMKVFHVEHAKEMDPSRFIFLGNLNGDIAVYNVEVNHPNQSLRLSHSHLFTDFFPRAQSYILSMDFMEINEFRRLWAFGYANGLVCVFSMSLCRFDNKSRLKMKVVEYDPIDNSPRKVDKDTQKLVIATHLSSPIHCVKLIKRDQQQPDEPFTIDLLVSCYDDKLVYYQNLVFNFMKEPSYFGDLNAVSCVNCLYMNENRVIIGDLANRVHLFKKCLTNDREWYSVENVIGVNDCVYNAALHDDILVITTRQGTYLFALSALAVCLRNCKEL